MEIRQKLIVMDSLLCGSINIVVQGNDKQATVAYLQQHRYYREQSCLSIFFVCTHFERENLFYNIVVLVSYSLFISVFLQ